MSAMKNLIENLRGIQLCMEDITRTMNLNDVESPLGMHGTPRHNVNSVTDARAVAAELDMSAVAGALDDGQIESISEQVQVNYCELADEISSEGLARYLDCEAIAKHIDSRELARHIATDFDAENVAHYMDCKDVAQHIRPDVVAPCIEVSGIVTAMMADSRFMDALAARLLDHMCFNDSFIDALATRIGTPQYAKHIATLIQSTDAPVPAVRSDADPLTGIEYGTPT